MSSPVRSKRPSGTFVGVAVPGVTPLCRRSVNSTVRCGHRCGGRLCVGGHGRRWSAVRRGLRRRDLSRVMARPLVNPPFVFPVILPAGSAVGVRQASCRLPFSRRSALPRGAPTRAGSSPCPRDSCARHASSVTTPRPSVQALATDLHPGSYSPTAPSMRSRNRSAWPRCRAYSLPR
jgi:hypothetical protein